MEKFGLNSDFDGIKIQTLLREGRWVTKVSASKNKMPVIIAATMCGHEI